MVLSSYIKNKKRFNINEGSEHQRSYRKNAKINPQEIEEKGKLVTEQNLTTQKPSLQWTGLPKTGIDLETLMACVTLVRLVGIKRGTRGPSTGKIQKIVLSSEGPCLLRAPAWEPQPGWDLSPESDG